MNPATIVCHSSAKVNLTLDVLGRRPDGYHELRSIVHTVDLYDTLKFEFGADDGFSCSKATLSTDDNLCVRAANLYYETANLDREKHPVFITLEKTIPAGAGLGGGSGNAAATLAALNRHFAALDSASLATLAARLGADVPLFLQGGCLLMEGIGEQITRLSPIDAWLVIVKPREHGDTKDIFAEWDTVERLAATAAPVNTNDLLAILKSPPDSSAQNSVDHLHKIGGTVGNGLRAAAQRCGMPVNRIETRLLAAGALGACMSGSGSACYGIFADAETAGAGLSDIREEAEDLESSWNAPLCSEALHFD